MPLSINLLLNVKYMNYASDHFNGKIFLNPVPTVTMEGGAYVKAILEMLKKHPGRTPDHPIGPFTSDVNLQQAPHENTVLITWLGHSSVLMDIDGTRLLIDPLWCERASPFSFMGPKRFFANPVSINILTQIDIILLSHDHYDHLDKASIIQLGRKNIPIITMLGVGKRLINWGIDPSLITEMDWWQTVQQEKLTITAAPTRHFSGRGLRDRNHTLWGSFAIKSPQHNIYFGADSGYYEGFKTIGERLGPFDLTMLEIGAYGKSWPAIHMGPEGAVQAYADLRGKLLMPIHWGTFNLAFHPWKEPVEKIIQLAKEKNISLVLPRPGITWNLQNGAFNSQWWQS